MALLEMHDVHTYYGNIHALRGITLNVEEGETQYARCAINMGIFAGRPNLSTQDRADFDKRGKKLKLQDPFVAKDDEGDKEVAKPAVTADK